MTLVVALQASDGIVIGGDGRGSFGDPRGFMVISDVRKKVASLGHYCGMGISGPPDIGSALLKDVNELLMSQNASSVEDVMHIVREYVKAQYNDWFGQMPWDKRPVISLIICGYEPQAIPRIYMISSEYDWAPMLSDSGFHVMGLPLFPTYLVNRFYSSSANMHSIAALVEYIISETAGQDPKVGGPITIGIVTHELGYRELNQEEVSALHCKNEKHYTILSNYFRGISS